MKKIEFTVLTSNELDDLVNSLFPDNKYFGKEKFESIPAFEWNNYSSYQVLDVGKEKYLHKGWEQEVENKFAGKKEYIGLCQILEYLCQKGKIESGNYLIEVYW